MQTPERLQKSDSRRYYLKNPKPSKTQQLHKGSTVSHVFFNWPNWTHLHIGDQDLAKDLNLGKVLEAFRALDRRLGDLISRILPFWSPRILGRFLHFDPTIPGYFMQPNGIAGVGQGAAASKVGLLRLGSRKKWENSSQRSLEIWI